jgi:hypothetical protein
MKTLSPDNTGRNAKGDAGDERHGAKHDDRNAAILHPNRRPTGCGIALQSDTGLHCWLMIGAKTGLQGRLRLFAGRRCSIGVTPHFAIQVTHLRRRQGKPQRQY